MEITHGSPFGGKSVAEWSISFVILSAALVVIVFVIGALIWFLLLNKVNMSESERNFFFRIMWGVWFVLTILLWCSVLSRLKGLNNIDLSDNGFFKFQMASSIFVAVFWLLLRFIHSDFPEFISALQSLFEWLIGLFTFSFITFAWGSGKRVPAKIYFGLLTNIITIVFAKYY